MYKLGIWVEVTTLVLPQENDAPEELRDIAEFVASVDKNIPWHVSRFHPDYKFTDCQPTPEAVLKRAQAIGEKAGLNYVYAGNVCRLAGNLDRAVGYYEKALAVKSGGRRLAQYQQRARDAIQAMELYDKLDVSRVRDGTHQGSCAGYRGPVEVAVKVAAGRITEARVTRHREDEYFFHLTAPQLPERIVKANTVKGVDTITGATVTGEAILNAAAQALRSGMD